MFHVRRRPADCAPRKRKKKPGSIGAGQAGAGGARDARGDSAPLLVELGPDGSAPHPGDTARTIRLTGDVMEVGSANGIALQLYGPHIQPRHCVIRVSAGGASTTVAPLHADAHTYVDGQRVRQATPLRHGSLVKFGHSNTYRYVEPAALAAGGEVGGTMGRSYESRSPRALSPSDPSRENIETTFDLEGNVETISTASGAREDNRSLESSSENRLSGIDRYPRGQDPILPAVLEFPEEPQEQFLARVITHLDVTTPTFRLAPAYTLYLCARYRASTHYRPELTPPERAHKLTLLLQHAAMLIRHTVQDRSTESTSQAFWLANASELLHFLKSDRHVSAFSLQAQDTLADAVQLAFKNLIACLTDELNAAMSYLMSVTGDDHPREIINSLSTAMNLLRKCRVNAALTIQLFSQLFHWISAKALSNVINNSNLCTRHFGNRLFNRLRNLQAWAESQGLELAAECHLAKIVQCAHLLQAPKYAPEDLANLSAVCFKLNSMQLGALLMQYKAEPGEKLAPPTLLEHASKAAESVADELARAEGRDVTLHDDPSLSTTPLLLPDDGYSSEAVRGVPAGLADFLRPLQAASLCRLAAQPTSSGQWTVYMSQARPASAMSATQPEVQVIRLHKSGGGMGLSIVAAKGAGQERLGIYVKSVVPGGAADRDGRLAAGDQLLSVDGQSLLGITQERAAEFLQRTGGVVALEVAKAGAVYHGLATLLQQPSPTPQHRGPRRMSERDLPSRVDSERTIPASKSVPALHQIHSPTTESTRPSQDLYKNNQESYKLHHHHQHPQEMYNGHGYSRTSSNNSINNHVGGQNGTLPSQGVGTAMRSRSTHNLHQQDGGFYQNLSIYRNKVPSPQHLGDRTSALRSSQNSLHSSAANSQRPSSAYYPPPSTASNPRPNNLHQSIPNLKSPPSGSTPYGQGYYPPYTRNQGYTSPEELKLSYYPNQTHGNTSNGPGYSNSLQQPLHINPISRQDDREVRYGNTGGGLLREDVFRQSERLRHEEILSRYPSQANVRVADAPLQLPTEGTVTRQELRPSKVDEIASPTLRSHHHHQHGGELTRYASQSNMREGGVKVEQQLRPAQDERHLRGAAKLAEMSEEVRRRQNRVQYGQQRDYYQQQQYYNHMMSQNAQSMQNLSINPHTLYNHQQQQQYSPQHQTAYQQQQNSYSQSQNSYPQQQNFIQQQNSYQSQQPNPVSPTYKSPPIAPKPSKKDDLPELPPTSTHPLYSASSQDPPKMAFYPAGGAQGASNKPPPRDPWAREEQERRQEARREAARQWRERQIGELASLPRRTAQQEEQLRVLQLEREFQRRAAQEAAEEEEEEEEVEDEEDEKLEGPIPKMPSPTQLQPVSSQTVISTFTSSTVSSKQDSAHTQVPPPASILKPNDECSSPPGRRSPVIETTAVVTPVQPAPPPPERGSSFAVMSMRSARGDSTKRVSFNDSSAAVSEQVQQQGRMEPPSTLQIEENIREDPNVFIRQAESMLASPTTPEDANGTALATSNSTPGVIGAQEVYRDPRAKRLAEQARNKDRAIGSGVPEKLSFKEKMKMFAMETGERETPKDKSKISRAQREIDGLGSPPSLVH